METEEIAPEEQFLILSTIFCYLMLAFFGKTRIRFSLRDKRLFEITEVEITRVDCIFLRNIFYFEQLKAICTVFATSIVFIPTLTGFLALPIA